MKKGIIQPIMCLQMLDHHGTPVCAGHPSDSRDGIPAHVACFSRALAVGARCSCRADPPSLFGRRSTLA